MIGMQYEIGLPADYDMEIIRERVRRNGHKTDGYKDLLFKAYLITTRQVGGNRQNSYCPLYVWKQQGGMNSFLFDGPYDAILDSFGWQHVQIGVPLKIHIPEAALLRNIRYVLECKGIMTPTHSLKGLPQKIEHDLHRRYAWYEDGSQGSLLMYNPDEWAYSQFYLLNDLPTTVPDGCTMYEVLHWSMGLELNEHASIGNKI